MQTNTVKIVLQWHSSGESPTKTATITSPADLLSPNGATATAMTVPMQRGSMAVLPSRSRFMITDILGGGAPNVGAALHLSRERVENGRSPSPQSPRDLSAGAANNNNHLHHLHHNLALNHHHHLNQHSHMHRHDDSDSDSSGGLDDNSVCSNGKLV